MNWWQSILLVLGGFASGAIVALFIILGYFLHEMTKGNDKYEHI